MNTATNQSIVESGDLKFVLSIRPATAEEVPGYDLDRDRFFKVELVVFQGGKERPLYDSLRLPKREGALPREELLELAKDRPNMSFCEGIEIVGIADVTHLGDTFALVAYTLENRPGRFEDRFVLVGPDGYAILNSFIRVRKSTEALEREAAEKVEHEAREKVEEEERAEALADLQSRIGTETPESKGRCPSCGHITDVEDFEQKVYECSRCGGTYREDDIEGHRCPDCNVFMAKLGNHSCPDCEEALEDGPEEIEVYEVEGDFYMLDETGKLVPAEEG